MLGWKHLLPSTLIARFLCAFLSQGLYRVKKNWSYLIHLCRVECHAPIYPCSQRYPPGSAGYCWGHVTPCEGISKDPTWTPLSRLEFLRQYWPIVVEVVVREILHHFLKSTRRLLEDVDIRECMDMGRNPPRKCHVVSLRRRSWLCLRQ